MSYDELLDSLTARLLALPGNPRENAMLFTTLLSIAMGGQGGMKGGETPDEI
jgi:hypothetical protein